MKLAWEGHSVGGGLRCVDDARIGLAGKGVQTVATFTTFRVAAAAAALAVLAGCASDRAATRGPTIDPMAFMALAPAETKEAPDWRPHFESVEEGAILINLEHRSLIYWFPGGETYREFPIAVPRNEDLERTGATQIVRMREDPDWRPTPSMIERNPDIPLYIGPGPQNPLGERALYLGWQYYAIHGTNNPFSIGTRATSGCFRMHPDDILWLYERASIGLQVVVVESLENV